VRAKRRLPAQSAPRSSKLNSDVSAAAVAKVPLVRQPEQSIVDAIIVQVSQQSQSSDMPSRAAARRVPQRTKLTQKELRLTAKIKREQLQSLVKSNASPQQAGRIQGQRGTKRGSVRDLSKVFKISKSTAWVWSNSSKVRISFPLSNLVLR
jgi:hypothetical protein